MYLTIAKGGLNRDHLLVVPIGHFQSTVECPPEVAEEVNKFKIQLIKFFEARDKAVIFFERNFKSPHLQIQVVPIEKSSLPAGLKLACLVSCWMNVIVQMISKVLMVIAITVNF